MPVAIITEIFSILTGLLQRKGVISDPEAQAAAAQAQAQAEAAFAQYIQATTPAVTYPWAAAAIALIRPALAVFSMVSFFLFPQSAQQFVRTVAQEAPWSILALLPMLVWVLGPLFPWLVSEAGLSLTLPKAAAVPARPAPPSRPSQAAPSTAAQAVAEGLAQVDNALKEQNR